MTTKMKAGRKVLLGLLVCLLVMTGCAAMSSAYAADSPSEFTFEEFSSATLFDDDLGIDLSYGNHIRFVEDDPEIVDFSGSSLWTNVKAKKRGTTIVRAFNVDTEIASWTITVTPKPMEFKSRTILEPGIGGYFKVTDGYKQYTWTFSDPSLLYVDESKSFLSYEKYIRAYDKKGTCDITVTNEYGESAVMTVTVGGKPFSVTVDEPEKGFYVGAEAKVKLAMDYAWTDCTFAFDKPGIAELRDTADGGKTLAVIGAGDVVLSVTNQYGEVVQQTIHAYQKPEKVGFKKDSITVYLGRPVKLPYYAIPKDSNYQVKFADESYSWNKGVVSVSEDGTITPLKVGEADSIVIRGEDGRADSCVVKVLKPSFSKDKYKLYLKKTLKLKVTGANPKTTWKSSNSAIASVDKNGKVTAKKAGTVTITANSGGTRIKTKIVVSKPKLSKTKHGLYAKKSFNLKVTGGVGKIKWTSSNKKVAIVNSKGKVTTKKVGTATITAKVSGVKLKCKVTVKPPKLSATKKTIAERMTFKLNVTGEVGKVRWSSSNSKVAKVSKSGKVTAKKPGTATITAKVDGRKLKCKIKVKKNQSIEDIYMSVFDYDYGSPSVPLRKAYYEDGKLKADVYVMNNRTFTANSFDWITYKLTQDGKTIASQTFYDVPIGIGQYSKKKITLTFKNSAIRRHVDLTKGVGWDYDYVYRWSYDY